jgi:hypothetical protein
MIHVLHTRPQGFENELSRFLRRLPNERSEKSLPASTVSVSLRLFSSEQTSSIPCICLLFDNKNHQFVRQNSGRAHATQGIFAAQNGLRFAGPVTDCNTPETRVSL